MAVNYNFKKGTDLPSWMWLNQFPSGPSYHGTSNVYDGTRYMYWFVQYTQTAGPTSGGTTQLWRYDTWTNGWQYLTQAAINGNAGIDLEFDRNRNVVYMIIGNSTTTIYCFNLNTTAVTVNNISCAPWAATALAALPIAASYGASLTMPDDNSVPTTVDNAVTATGSTTTSLIDTAAGNINNAGSFAAGMVGMQARYTSGVNNGAHRIITAVGNPTTLTVNAFGSAPAAGDTFVVELPAGTVTTGGSTTTLTDANAGWTTNMYANSDVVMTSGAANGQRRRITSNTGTVLTLSSAVTGNSRTGPFGTAPAAADSYQIVPSSDFLYFQPGNNGTGLYRLDVVQTTGSAWSAALAAVPGGINGGGNTFHPAGYAPFQILALRGGGTANLYNYNIGLNTWGTINTYAGSETFNTGASAGLMQGFRRLMVQTNGSQRSVMIDLTTGVFETGPFLPYAPPGAYDGKRLRHVQTADGVDWVYAMRGGGQEFWRLPLEWLT